MVCPKPHSRRKRSRGTVLIVAMWIVLALSGLVLVFAGSMRVELAATANHAAALECSSAARGALQLVLARVDATGGTPPDDAEYSYEAVEVGDAYFWILKPSFDDERTHAFGIRDEASRLNLNCVDVDALLKLPTMTPDLAAAIVDWRDSDDEVSPGGAESEYYLLLPDPYIAKNGPFEALGELNLVKGAFADLLHGEDWNRNGVLDANENDAADSSPPDNRDGRLDRGVSDYLTVYSVEPNMSSSGEARVNVNDVDTSELAALLEEVVDEDRFFQVMDLVRRRRPFANTIHFCLRTGLTPEEFAQVSDRLTTTDDEELVGLVNVATAPREVLLCLPGLEESDVDAIAEKRASPDTDLTNIAWVAGVLPEQKAADAGGMMTVRSFQFSADIVAVSHDGRAFRRYLAVIDARSSPPEVLRWQDLTHLGWPLEAEILESLRDGDPPVASTRLAFAGGR